MTRLIYSATVLAVSLVAFGAWGVPAAALVLLFWWLSRQQEMIFHALALVTLVVLVAGLLMVPAVFLAREAAFRDQCRGHLKQQWLAIANFNDTEGHLPPLGPG